MLRDVPDSEMLVSALIENIHRADLGSMERARGFARLRDELQLTHERIAEITGIARPSVSNSLRLLDLDAESMEALESRRITEGHARTLLAVSPGPKRKTLLKSILEGQMNVRSAELESASIARRGPRRDSSPDAKRLAARLSEALECPVEIRERGRGGRIVIQYRRLEQFDKVFSRIVGVKPSQLTEG
jgi:ParB family chromosome partitioning protein